jgi:hypothetical protein
MREEQPASDAFLDELLWKHTSAVRSQMSPAQLEDLEKYTRHGEALVKVSGTVTLYQGRNYLLLSQLSRQEY